MKQVKKLKFSELSKKELKELKGGDYCRDKCGTSSPTIGSAYGEWTAYF